LINQKAARRYTKALFEIASEQKITDQVIKDFVLIKSTIEASSDLLLFLNTPLINGDKKAKVISVVFAGKVSDLTIKFLQILCQKNRENLLFDISTDFSDLIKEEKGILDARIKTAVEISDESKKTLTAKLKQYTGKEINAEFSVDPSIKAGFVAKIQDTIIDASIKRQLEILRQKFMEGNFNN